MKVTERRKKNNELSATSKNLINKLAVEAHSWGAKSPDLLEISSPAARATVEIADRLREHVRGLERQIVRLEKSNAKMKRQLEIVVAGDNPGEIRELPKVKVKDPYESCVPHPRTCP